jgi:hypothetical protein
MLIRCFEASAKTLRRHIRRHFLPEQALMVKVQIPQLDADEKRSGIEESRR